MGIFFVFLLALSAGVLTTLFWIPEDDLGRGYFLVNALVTLGLLGLAAGVAWFHPFEPFADGSVGPAALVAALAGAFAYYAAVWGERWTRARLAAVFALGATVTALLAAGTELAGSGTPLPHHRTLLFASLISSALLLGWSLITMLLGHWYLIAPKLTFRHLTVFSWTLVAIVVARGIAVGSTVAAARNVDPLVDPHPWRLLASFEGEGMFFWFRILWGLAIPLALSAMAVNCARQRSNQSATGILYVLVVGALIGEITSYFLTAATGVPV